MQNENESDFQILKLMDPGGKSYNMSILKDLLTTNPLFSCVKLVLKCFIL